MIVSMMFPLQYCDQSVVALKQARMVKHTKSVCMGAFRSRECKARAELRNEPESSYRVLESIMSAAR